MGCQSSKLTENDNTCVRENKPQERNIGIQNKTKS